jgi:CubicO group peptidase (beta-lactamase class C family)
MSSLFFLATFGTLSAVRAQTGYKGGYGNLDRMMEGLSAEYGNGGCTISVIKAGDVLYNYGTGEIDIDGDNKIMRVASLSKNVAAVAMGLALGEDANGYGFTVNSTIGDVLAMDADKLAIFQKFSTISAYMDVITIKQLLSMNGGFRHYEKLHEYLWAPDEQDSRSDLEQYLSLFGDDDLWCEPGTCYKYSSFGYFIVAELIEVISGMDFYEFQEQKIYAALGLDEMGDRDTLDRLLYAKSYKRVCDQVDRGYKFTADCDLNDTLSDIQFDDIVFYKKAAGNVLSTSLDYAKYIDTVVWNRDDFLPAAFHDQMHHGQTFYKTTDYYGYGWHMNAKDEPTVYWHTGGAVGGVTIVRVQMEQELVSTVFCDIQAQSAGIYALLNYVEDFFGADFNPNEFTTTSDEDEDRESGAVQHGALLGWLLAVAVSLLF